MCAMNPHEKRIASAFADLANWPPCRMAKYEHLKLNMKLDNKLSDGSKKEKTI